MIIVLRIWSASPLPAAGVVLGRMTLFEPLLWFAGVLVALLAATVLLLYLRGRVRAGLEESAKLPLTLSDLRHQRDSGRLTNAEYEAIKEIVIRDVQSESGETNGTSPDNVLQEGSKR